MYYHSVDTKMLDTLAQLDLINIHAPFDKALFIVINNS